MYSLGASTFSGSTIAPACIPVYSLGASAFSGSTIAPACTPVYSLGGSTFSGSTIAPACTPVYSLGASTFSGSTIAPACGPVYSDRGAICSGSTIAPACTPAYSGSTFSGSTIAPAWTPVYSGSGAICSGSTIAPDCGPVYSGSGATCSGSPLSLTTASGNAGWIAGSPLSVTTAAGSLGWIAGSTIAPDCTSLCSTPVSGCSFITWAFLVPFSTILGTGAVVEVETISRETSSFFTENILTISTFLPNLPSCFTLTVPSAKSGFSWISSWKSIFVSIVSSRYKSSGLFNWPDKTSSCGFNVFTPVFSFGEFFSSFFVSRFLCSANCAWESEDCFSSFLGFINSVERGFSTTWTSVGLVEEAVFSSWIACTVDGWSTKFGVTL